jgi:hypothetical protein
MHGDNLNADFSQFPTEISLAEGFHEASPIPDTNAPAPHSFSSTHIGGTPAPEGACCTTFKLYRASVASILLCFIDG